MTHEAFEVLGERVLLEFTHSPSWYNEIPTLLQTLGRYDTQRIKDLLASKTDIESGQKLGIFHESEEFRTVESGIEKPALDFIQPIYRTNPAQEENAKGKVPKERVNPLNPILSLHLGIDHLLLEHKDTKNGAHIFTGPLWYVQGVFYNDGNWEVFNKYVEPLKKAGFKAFSV